MSQSTGQHVTEERLRRALRGGRIVAWEWDLETGRLQWSDNVVEILGGTLQTQADFEASVHPDDRARHRAAIERTVPAGEPFDVELRFMRPDASVIWIQNKAELQCDENGRRMVSGITIDITARRRAEEGAREEAAALEAILDHMEQGLIMVDRDEVVRIQNRRAVDLLDLPEQLARVPFPYEAIRRHQTASGEFARSDPAFQRWLWSGPNVEQPVRYERERPNGTILEVRSIPLPTGGALRTFTDITAQRRAESELREREERFRLATRATNDAIWDWDLLTGRIRWTEAVEVLFGYREEEVSTEASWWTDRVHPDDRERVLAELRAVMDGADAHWSAEYRFRKADGDYVDVLDRGHVIREPGGRSIRMVGAMMDQTQQKAAQAALQESEHRYRLLADNTGDMVVLTGPDAVRRYVSPASKDVLGYEPDELLGVNASDQTHPDDLDRVAAQFREMFVSRVPTTKIANYRLRHKGGHWVVVEARRRLVFDENGQPEAILSAIRDISERVQLEERLRQAQKMEAMGQLTGGVAHDFNNLLTVILGNSEVLAEGHGDAHLQDLALMIQEAALKGAGLTQHLLAFARRQTLKPERLSLPDVVRRLEPLLRRTISESIEIDARLDGAEAAALADRSLLETALLNLAVNAKDAMPDGGSLTIATGARRAGANEGLLPEGRPLVFVTVSDTGTGMAPEVLERAFEPFFTTKEVGKGSGLGLSMVYGFAQQSGGHVAIESRPGHGTAVTVMLPAVASTPARQRPQPAILQGGRERVLVVEDEAQVRTFICGQLADLGYRVEAVSNGPEALAILERDGGFDLLFTDVVLPKGMSGVELAGRAQGLRPGLKVLFSSGYAEDAFDHYGRPESGAVLLRKPFKRKDLAETVRSMLD